MSNNQTTNRPVFEAFTVSGEGEKAYWTKIGAVWRHGKGDGMTLNLTALPLDGKIVFLPPKTQTEQPPKTAKKGGAS